MADAVLHRLRDPFVKDLYKDAIRRGSRGGRKIYKREAKEIFEEVLIDDEVDKDEAHDLVLIMENSDLSRRAKRYLEETIEKNKRAIQEGNRKRLRGRRLRDIANLLRPNNVGHADFWNPVHLFRYDPAHYETVRKLILRGHIKIYEFDFGGLDEVDEVDLRSRGTHRSKENEILIKKGKTGTTLAGIVIHEATHAIQDWMNVRMRLGSYESDAFIAQALVYHVKGRTPSGRAGRSPLKTAWEGAAKMIFERRRHRRLDWDEFKDAYEEVVTAISNHPGYGSRAGKMKNFGKAKFGGRSEKATFARIMAED